MFPVVASVAKQAVPGLIAMLSAMLLVPASRKPYTPPDARSSETQLRVPENLKAASAATFTSPSQLWTWGPLAFVIAMPPAAALAELFVTDIPEKPPVPAPALTTYPERFPRTLMHGPK